MNLICFKFDSFIIIKICEAQINILTIFRVTESLLIYRVRLGKEVAAIAVFVRIKKRQP